MEISYLVIIVFALLFFPMLLGWAAEGSNREASVSKVEPRNATLLKELKEMKIKRGSAYVPRTKHLLPDGSPKYTNRLFLESSPYLQQHAHNPVDWYPWGDEAFETAGRLDRPVFVSIGYSTCHWCHVMEEETFEDEEIAAYINTNYVPVKVDREERPDVDAVYMSAVQLLTGGGGWPLNVWLFPDGKPFFGGTYFPPRDGDRGVNMGFLTVIGKLKEAYDRDRSRLGDISVRLSAEVGKMMVPEGGYGKPSGNVLPVSAAFFANLADPVHGGLRGAPKFPSSLPIRFFLRQAKRDGNEKLLDMATLALRKMAAGGMYDHIGGGFHRYSTDSRWLVPHFEKMLYDNALLVVDYVEGWQATGEEDFRTIAEEILAYVDREMMSPDGAFYSATDADSPTPDGRREEGWFFTWTPEEIESALGGELAKIVTAYYGITGAGNFEGRNIPNTPKPVSEVANELGISETALSDAVREAKTILLKTRDLRPKPIRDEKILTAWNGLMISALAKAGLAFGNPEYTARAEKAARFVMDKLYKNGRLRRSHKDGADRHNAYLEDYAFMIAALADLYEASGNAEWLKSAVSLDDVLEAYYEDGERGGFFMTASDHEKLLAREKPANDGAVPSGNSVMVLNLLRLYGLTGRDAYRKRAEKTLAFFSKILEEKPATVSTMLLAVDYWLDTPKEIVIVTPNGKRDEAGPFLAELGKRFLPNRVLAVAEEGEAKNIQDLIPLFKHRKAVNGKTAAYVCKNRVCKLPADDPAQLGKHLE